MGKNNVENQTMDTLTVFIYGLVPLIAFAIADLQGNPRVGVVLAVVISLAEVIWMYVKFEMLDPVSVVAFVLILALGFWTLKKRDTRFFKYQPVVVGVFAASFTLYVQLVGPSVMERYGELLAEMLPQEKAYYLQNPEFVAYMDRLVLAAAPAFLLHAAWCAWAASRWSTQAWIWTRALGFWAMMIPMAIIIPRVFPP